MEEAKLLGVLLSEGSDYLCRDAAANLLLEKLSKCRVSRDTLDQLDKMLNGAEKVAMEESLREKLQTIALNVDALILSKPRKYELKKVRWIERRMPKGNEHSGSWERETAKRKLDKTRR